MKTDLVPVFEPLETSMVLGCTDLEPLSLSSIESMSRIRSCILPLELSSFSEGTGWVSISLLSLNGLLFYFLTAFCLP